MLKEEKQEEDDWKKMETRWKGTQSHKKTITNVRSGGKKWFFFRFFFFNFIYLFHLEMEVGLKVSMWKGK